MSLFPPSLLSDNPVSSFTPLFRLLDDYDNYSRRPGGYHHRSQFRTFSPKFDVKETPQAYELHGELPGVEQKDVEIEFTDQQTLTVKGRTERSYTKGTPPAGFIEEPKMSSAITEGGEVDAQKTQDQHSAQGNNANNDTAVAKADENKEPNHQLWVSERSVGEFSRSFSFSTPVDQDQVKASMKNGILSIVLPKAKKVEGRKITIS